MYRKILEFSLLHKGSQFSGGGRVGGGREEDGVHIITKTTGGKKQSAGREKMHEDHLKLGGLLGVNRGDVPDWREWLREVVTHPAG